MAFRATSLGKRLHLKHFRQRRAKEGGGAKGTVGQGAEI